MTLKKMIDGDKICADQLFLRKSASLFSSLPVSAGRVACFVFGFVYMGDK